MSNNFNLNPQETILIVDDCPDNLNLLNVILSKADYKVYLAPSGNLALRFMESNSPDLILLDIMMPKLDGYAVCEQIKASKKHQEIPIIFISALQEVSHKIKAFSMGGSDYITKPFQEQEILIRVKNQLRLKSLSRQLINQNIIEERNRIAREIHDTLAQAFTGIIIQLRAAERRIEIPCDQVLAHIQTAQELAKTGLAEARRSVEALRPKLLEEGDLSSALNRIVTQMSTLNGICTRLETIGQSYALPVEVESNLLRIGQEALTNAFKYSKASSIKVELVYNTSQFILHIKDNGQGFDMQTLSLSQGFGFLGMRERAERMGAQLTVCSQPGKGTEVKVSLEKTVNWFSIFDPS